MPPLNSLKGISKDWPLAFLFIYILINSLAVIMPLKQTILLSSSIFAANIICGALLILNHLFKGTIKWSELNPAKIEIP